MKKYILLSFAFGLLIITASCEKEKPTTVIIDGIHMATFSYDSPGLPDDTVLYIITDTNKNYFLIGFYNHPTSALGYRDTIYKNKNEVNGRIPAVNFHSSYRITGKGSPSLPNQGSIIEGVFTVSQYAQGGSIVVDYPGKFSIKPIF